MNPTSTRPPSTRALPAFARFAPLRRAGVGLLVLGLLGTVPALAADKGAKEAPAEEVDEDAIAGELVISMKLPFVKFTVDGKEWDNHEYTGGNKTLVIRGLGRDAEHTVVLTPREGGFDPKTLTIAPAAFKKTVVKQKGRTRFIVFRANEKVDFVKEAPPAPKDEAPKK